MHRQPKEVGAMKSLKGYTNWGGCQMGNAISIIEEDKNSDCSFFANEGFVRVKAVN